MTHLESPWRYRTARPVALGGCQVGGPTVVVIAGPCSVETAYPEHARAVACAGAHALRGCLLKPRTRPSSFQGLGACGLHLLDEARAATGLPIVSEPLEVQDVVMLAGHCDAFQIGARSMQNTPLLRAVGRTGLPVILKRGLSATYDEWLGAAEYVLAEGNDCIILCERGIRTFETVTRSTLDLAAIPVMRERTPFPIIVDPSHAAGRRGWVPSLAAAAIAGGADGLLIEAHPAPAASWSDADQAISPATLAGVVRMAKRLETLIRPPVDGSVAETVPPDRALAGVTAAAAVATGS